MSGKWHVDFENRRGTHQSVAPKPNLFFAGQFDLPVGVTTIRAFFQAGVLSESTSGRTRSQQGRRAGLADARSRSGSTPDCLTIFAVCEPSRVEERCSNLTAV